ncbi:uncharacterized protein LOC107370934 [Tetranychus urticae]|uniref:BACK domain-containing protein n=1 Tax=Tetranychus urticae TaxID=32264 RepID=T1JY90_TETUR|nr:uncharacterized protein LOC107370934 [Tetranychus urticae]
MDSLDTDDQLTIVNRSTEYRISKKLISKIPYFEMILSHDCSKLRTNKVTFDFDEQAVKSIMAWIKRETTIITIEMNYVFDLYELADYLGLDVISKECLKYFEDNFTIEHLPSFIPKVTKTSKCISSAALNAFICRYFLRIKDLYSDSIDDSRKAFWLEYPIETIEYICALDLMICSEYQVFDVIMRWVNFKAYSRKCHLVELLKLVRWCHLSEQDLSKIKENGLFKSSGFEPIFCSPRKVNCECTVNRTKQNFLIMIEKWERNLDFHDKLTIVNRSSEYKISKQKIRKIPYFEKMLSHDCLETKTSKVVLDFDEKAFNLLLHWIEFDNLIVDMECYIALYDISDYFEINYLMQKCIDYFNSNFSMEHLPTVIPQMTETSILINSGALNAFICFHFLKIASTTVWLDYPVETIEYICALDLMVHSEYQVFVAIVSWVDFNADSRNFHRERLLRLVRCCHLESEVLSVLKKNKAMFESSGSEPFCWPICYCFSDRAKQNCFIIIEKLQGTDLRITALGNNFLFLFNRDIKLDESISLNLLHDEYVSDIFYHSGSKAIRIDWNRRKYRFFNDTDLNTYISDTFKFIGLNNDSINRWLKYWERTSRFLPIHSWKVRVTGSEVKSFHGHEEKFEYLFKEIMRTDDKIRLTDFHYQVIKHRVTVLSDNIFILTNDFEFGKFNAPAKHFTKIEYPKTIGAHVWTYDNLYLTSSVDYPDRVFLIVRSSRDVFCFNINNEEWSRFGRLAYSCAKRSRDYGQDESNKLITLTPALLPLNMIKP